jgi:hypothetical protein
MFVACFDHNQEIFMILKSLLRCVLIRMHISNFIGINDDNSLCFSSIENHETGMNVICNTGKE